MIIYPRIPFRLSKLSKCFTQVRISLHPIQVQSERSIEWTIIRKLTVFSIKLAVAIIDDLLAIFQLMISRPLTFSCFKRPVYTHRFYDPDKMSIHFDS